MQAGIYSRTVYILTHIAGTRQDPLVPHTHRPVQRILDLRSHQ